MFLASFMSEKSHLKWASRMESFIWYPCFRDWKGRALKKRMTWVWMR